VPAALLGLMGLVAPTAWAHPGPPSSVFDQNQVFWQVLVNRTSSQFATEFNNLLALGYMVIDLEVQDDGRVSAAWQDNTDNRGWRSLRNMTYDSFAAEHAEAVADGMRIVDFEVYVNEPCTVCTVRFAAVWVENREGYSWSFRYDLRAADLSSYVTQQDNAGRMPIEIERYRGGQNCACYAAIWVNNVEDLDWRLHFDLTSAEYGQRWEQYRSTFRPLVVQRHGSEYAGIWVENRNGRAWISSRGVRSDFEVEQAMTHYRSRGYRLVGFEKAPVGDDWWYGMIWRQNN
jgi:hypothetical protein